MKKVSLVSLACATALAIFPAILVGQQIDFSINGSGISASGTITVATTATPGVDEITGISGTYSDSNGSVPVVDAAITGLYPDPSYTPIQDSYHLFQFDNLLYTSGNGGLYLDNNGMLFVIANGDEVGVCGTSCATTTNGTAFSYNLDREDSGNYQENNEGVGVQFSAPEGGATLLYLLLAGATCFGAMFFSSRSRIENRASV